MDKYEATYLYVLFKLHHSCHFCLHVSDTKYQRYATYVTDRSRWRARSVARGLPKDQRESRHRAFKRLENKGKLPTSSRRQQTPSPSRSSSRQYPKRTQTPPRSPMRKASRHRSQSPRSMYQPTARDVERDLYPHYNESYGRSVLLPELGNVGPVLEIGGLPVDASNQTPPAGTSIEVDPEMPKRVARATERDVTTERITIRPANKSKNLKPALPMDHTCSLLAPEVIEMAYRDSLIHKSAGWPCPTRQQVLAAIQDIPDELGTLRMVRKIFLFDITQ